MQEDDIVNHLEEDQIIGQSPYFENQGDDSRQSLPLLAWDDPKMQQQIGNATICSYFS